VSKVEEQVSQALIQHHGTIDKEKERKFNEELSSNAERIRTAYQSQLDQIITRNEDENKNKLSNALAECNQSWETLIRQRDETTMANHLHIVSQLNDQKRELLSQMVSQRSDIIKSGQEQIDKFISDLSQKWELYQSNLNKTMNDRDSQFVQAAKETFQRLFNEFYQEAKAAYDDVDYRDLKPCQWDNLCYLLLVQV